MEQVYAFLLRNRKSLYSFTFAYVIGIISGVLSDSDFRTVSELVSRFIPGNNLSLLLMYLLILACTITELAYLAVRSWCQKKSSPAVLADQMEKNTEPYFGEIGFRGGYSWAADRTWIVCENIFTGWKPESFFVEELNTSQFSFGEKYPELKTGYQQFMDSSEAHEIIRRKNNNTRIMLTNVVQNFSRQDKQIYFYLRQTDWCTNSFLWKYMRAHPNFKAKKIGDLYTGKGEILPNSLCLHLILVTSDNQIVLARISTNKRNDYPSTWAATIGEQLEPQDVVDHGNYSPNFIRNWVRRAMEEEFGIDKSNFDVVINSDSVRVLALNVEGDIYNISVVTEAKLQCNFKRFLEYLRKTPDSEKEFADLKVISYSEVPQILADYQKNKSEYHPSTYLRLYLCYIHRYGVDRFVRKYPKKLDSDEYRAMMTGADG